VQGVDIGAAVCGQRDHVDPLFFGLAQAHDMMLMRAIGGEIDHAVLLARLDQFPLVGIKGALGLQIGQGVTHITNFCNAAHSGFLQIGWETIANISAVAL
jgi:hypothetical protein